MNDYGFGNFVCMLREKQGLTQAELAGLLGITAAAVSKWENGESKPRVEMLFRLAEILKVRPEELMAGKYLQVETLNPEAVEQINLRYEYLRKVDSHVMVGTKMRRLAAWLIDWNLSCISMLVPLFCVLFGYQLTQASWLFVLVMACMLLMFVIFVFRDFVFRGRSIGKRIMGLVVLDKHTATKASLRQCALRNLFFMAYTIDAIIMLITGMTIGDYVANTVVVSKKYLDAAENHTEQNAYIASINAYKVPNGSTRRFKWKIFILVLLFIVLLLTVIWTAVSCTLDSVTDSEQYAVAYEYLINSEAFERLGVSPDKVRLRGYNYQKYINGEHTSNAATFTFGVDSYTMVIVCHKDMDSWYVCRDCTDVA